MKIAIIGSGYVGLVSGTCLAEFGFNITSVDRDEQKIAGLQQGKIPIYEPGLEDLIAKNVKAKRLQFTTDLAAAVPEADAVFIAVGTPEGEDGMPDLRSARAAVKAVAKHLQGYTVIVNKSTVPVGFGREVQEIVAAENLGADFDVASNPEFLREGSAIGDFMRPDRVVIGTTSARAEAVMREIYRPLFLNETPIVASNLETAELTKYAGNAFLANKIAFINQIADLCEEVGADVQAVARGIGLDNRIGKKFLHAGPGYGGSCFPKDTAALAAIGRKHGRRQSIIEGVIAANKTRKADMSTRVIAAVGGNANGKTIAVLGLTFKPNTDDMRDSVSLDVVPALQAAGAKVVSYDPEGMREAAHMLPGLAFANDAYAAATGADAVVILTEWNEFRALDLAQLRGVMRAAVLVDLRNIYKPAEARAAGFAYSSIGRA